MPTRFARWLRVFRPSALRAGPQRGFRPRPERLEDRDVPAAGVLQPAAGDVNGDGYQDLVVGAGSGGEVRVFDGLTHQLTLSFTPYPEFSGGVFVATGDVDGDGKAEILTGPGSGGGPVVGVFDGTSGARLRSVLAYEDRFRGGVTVAAADVTGDGRADLITGTGDGGGPRVRVIDLATGTTVADFFSYEPSYRNGVVVAAAAGRDGGAIVTGTGVGGGPRVRTFDGRDGTPRADFFAYEPSFRNGVWVAAADTDGDGVPNIVTGTGVGGGPVVSVFAADGAPAGRFFAGGAGDRDGVAVGAADVTGDGRADLLGGFASGTVAVFTATTATQLFTLTAFDSSTATAGTSNTPATGANSPPPQATTPPPTPAATDTTPPRVIGASSTGNVRVRVAYSEPMGDSAINPQNYVIGLVDLTPPSILRVTDARFTGADRTFVELTTEPQNELTYQITVVYATDTAGNPLAAPVVGAGGIQVNSNQATFPGTPPVKAGLIDTDGDGLSDNDERRGWQVTAKLASGLTVERWVTGDPYVRDTDNDGLPDNVEAQLRLDPRDPDTDDDLLTDATEYDDVYSDPLNADTDADGVDDGTEYLTFLTSPVHADTDGDQIPDGDEINLGGFRNPLVSDLPQPRLSIGQTDLQLDVRFTESSSGQQRTLQSKSVSSSLSQSKHQEFSSTSEQTFEATSEISASRTFGMAEGLLGPEPVATNTVTASVGFRGSYTSSYSTASAADTQRAYDESLQTDAEVTNGNEVTREVVGAKLQVAVTLRAGGSIPFRIQNLQLSAFLQDPQDPTKLTPVATLLPDAEPANGFTLGPLTPERGPLIFSNSTIFPNAVESLMANPRGLVMRFSNFDLSDDQGRNFDFNSRAVVERTGLLTIDNGSFDANGDGVGDGTEYLHVATYSGRPVDDTNQDGTINNKDHRITFDPHGHQVGITLRTALKEAGLQFYDEALTPSDTLTDAELQNSYSTKFENGKLVIWRIRQAAREHETSVTKRWYVITPTGIDSTAALDSTVLTTGSNVTLALVEDADGDGMPANLEYLYGSSDSDSDTDNDTIPDRIESLVGWQIKTDGGTRRVFPSPTLQDSDHDGLRDDVESPDVDLLRDTNGDGLKDKFQPDSARKFDLSHPFSASVDDITDPLSPDTDGDGISDYNEVHKYAVSPRGGGAGINVRSNPSDADTDGDTAPDGVEARLGGNPLDANDKDKFADDDRDGLANIEEDDGWDVTLRRGGAATTSHVKSDKTIADSDGDGLTDGEEFNLGTIPGFDLNGDGVPDATALDSDQDGLSDIEEARGLILRDLGVISLNPTDSDTDHDGRGDGAEVEVRADYWLTPQVGPAAPIGSSARAVDPANYWVVRVAGKAPKRVFSDPRVADGDFDGLPDGAEFAYRSDPAVADTDGDGRFDGADVDAVAPGLSPTVEDYLVTVVFQSLYIRDDGDGGSNAGDFGFDFAVRTPDSSRPDGLGVGVQHVVVEQQLLTDAPGLSTTTTRSDVEWRLPQGDGSRDQTLVKNYGDTWAGLMISYGSVLRLDELMPVGSRSYQFAVGKDQRFAIEGVVAEFDQVDTPTDGKKVHLGGLQGRPGKVDGHDLQAGIVDGRSLEVGSITTAVFKFDTTDTVSYDDNIAGLFPGDDDKFSGELRVTYLVN